MKTNSPFHSNERLVAMDICALYPNIIIDVAMEALKDALCKCSSYNDEQIDMLLVLTRYCLENSVVQYRGDWYKSKEGAPTGGPEVPAIANIHVKFVLDEKILSSIPRSVNKLCDRSRFLDDIWGRWLGTPREFDIFLNAVNGIGKDFGVTFTGECGGEVVFLDVKVSNTWEGLETTMYIKPTDSARYLHRRSGHSRHTFTGIPFSQFRRAVVICSTENEKQQCIERMEKKFVDSGYAAEDLQEAKEKALALDRRSILQPVIQTEESPKPQVEWHV